MLIKNTKNSYGLVAIAMHWIIALLIIGLFIMGIWMRELGYYDPWYHRAPELHKSFGLLVFFLLIFRYLWRQYDPLPEPSSNLARWEKVTSRIAHASLYLLALLVIGSGYLMATADNVGVTFFGWFNTPVIVNSFNHQEDIAGEIHKIIAWIMMALVLLHSLAALKHHFLDKDVTLSRMLGISRRP